MNLLKFLKLKNEKVDINNQVINKHIHIVNKKEPLIPKQIYFINVGKKHELWMDLCINSFKDLNPDFKVDLLEMTYSEFFKCDGVYGILVKRKLTGIPNLSYQQFNQVLDDWKYYLIYKYGGIYSSLTNFNVLPLDSTYEYNGFITTKIENNNPSKFGCLFGSVKNNNSQLVELYPPVIYGYLDYYSQKLSFYNGNLRLSMIDIINEKMQSIVLNYDT